MQENDNNSLAETLVNYEMLIEMIPELGEVVYTGMVTLDAAKAVFQELSEVNQIDFVESLPALKGEAFVFDLKEFAREKGVSKIVDLGGKEWDIFTDQIDMVVTKSQFKFWNLYLDDAGKFDCQKWKSAFEEEVHGYKRTFNVAKYADAPEDLRNTSLLSYQPLQTVRFTFEEAEQLVSDSVSTYERIKSSVDEFLKYCGVSEEAEYIKPYYQALQYNHALANDTYVRGKMQDDIMSTVGTAMKSILTRMTNIKSGKLELVDEDGTTEKLSDVETTLANVGINLRKTMTEYNSASDVLDALASKWDTLNQAQQNAIAISFGGSRMQNQFRVLMENYDRVQKYTDVAANSDGQGEQKFG